MNLLTPLFGLRAAPFHTALRESVFPLPKAVRFLLTPI
jgi:hypothetical protein